MTDALLDIQQLTIAFEHTKSYQKVVDQLSFQLQRGQCLGLVGESGSGKSMSAQAIMQLLPHTAVISEQSRIHFRGEEILAYSEKQMRQIRGRHIGMIFQDAMSAFNPVLTIGHQLREVLTTHFKLSNRKAKQRSIEMLDEVGIVNPDRAYRAYAHELSGGMRQRAMIAMALCGEPELLIADEPTTALDVTIQAQVIQLLKRIQQTHNTALLFISHDLAVVSQLADDVVVLQEGVKVEHAPAQEFFREPKHEYSKALIAAIPPNQARLTPHEHEKLLSVENLRVYFPIRSNILRRRIGAVKAVDDVSLTIDKGQTLALVGESGSGKTTTGKAILKLIKPTAGAVYINDTNLFELSHSATRRMRQSMQFIFQDPYASLNPRMLVGDSIAEGLLALGKAKNRKAAFAKVDELLEQVSLPTDMKWRYPHEFSGGQRQRVCIARALALEPQLLILDEPTSALDVSIQMQILNLLEDLQQRLKLSYLLITHNISVVAYLAHHIAVMYHGKIIESGTCTDILESPQHEYTQQLLASVPQIITEENAYV